MDRLLAFFGSRFELLICVLLAALGAYLLWIHAGHVVLALPYLILLACPLMHIFGHKHGNSNRHPREDGRIAK